jgi:hypothetical protein
VFGKNSNLKLAYEKQKNGPVANDANSGRSFELFHGNKIGA